MMKSYPASQRRPLTLCCSMRSGSMTGRARGFDVRRVSGSKPESRFRMHACMCLDGTTLLGARHRHLDSKVECAVLEPIQLPGTMTAQDPFLGSLVGSH